LSTGDLLEKVTDLFEHGYCQRQLAFLIGVEYLKLRYYDASIKARENMHLISQMAKIGGRQAFVFLHNLIFSAFLCALCCLQSGTLFADMPSNLRRDGFHLCHARRVYNVEETEIEKKD
jgi:hypothetical protein